MKTYEDFLKTINSGMLGADGRFLGPGAGVNYKAEGLTPEEFYTGKSGYDPMPYEDNDLRFAPGQDDASWIEGAQNTGARGEFLAALAATVGGFGLAGAYGGGAAGLGGATATPVTGGTLGVTGTELGALGAGGAPMTLAEQMASYGAGGGGVTGGLATGTVGGFTGAAGGDLVGAAAGSGSGLSSLLGNKTLMQVGGGLLGALAGKDTTTIATSSKDPWGPAQGYLKDNLTTNAAMQKYYQENPFSAEQKTAYQGLLNTNANNQANVPIMQGNANNFMQSKRGVTPAMQGLLSGTQAAPIDWAKYANIGAK